MLTRTGNAAGAASPNASSARAIRPATTSGRRSSLLRLSLGAHLDELDPRRTAARTLARQHRVYHLEVAGQTPPGRRRVRVTGANRPRLVGHWLRVYPSHVLGRR